VRRKRIRQFYLNGNLHKVLHVNRPSDIVTTFDYAEGKVKTYPWSHVKRQRQNAYTIKEAAELVGRHRDRLVKYMVAGSIEIPQREYNIETGRLGRYFFSEDDMMDLRDYMATLHQGRPRKDGKVTNSRLPTREELRTSMKTGKVLYMKEGEEFVPVWRAESW
jgi:hypothetical protein